MLGAKNIEDRIDDIRERAFHLVLDEVERATQEHGERQKKHAFSWVTLLVKHLGQLAAAAMEYTTDPSVGRPKLLLKVSRVLAVGLLLTEQLLLDPHDKRPN